MPVINLKKSQNIQKDPLAYEVLDNEISAMIDAAALTQKKNSFFQAARATESCSLESALHIAYNWRAFTKQFVFTTITGLGTLADEVRLLNSPPDSVLHVLQTGFAIVSDDLMNASPILSEVAPKGPAGIHYRWWQDTILTPLENLAAEKNLNTKLTLTKQTNQLLDKMAQLAKTNIGAVVQLRVVEAIAYDIVLAFRIMYANLQVDGAAVFPHRDDLAWMNSHVKAEVIHHRQATDDDSSLVRVANTSAEQEHLLATVQEYIDCWVDFLNSFAQFLKG